MGEILVGLDGSPRSAAVLEAAVDLAMRTGDKLVLFRSIGVPPEMPADVWKLEEGSLLESLREHAKAYLSECSKKVPQQALAPVRVEVGVPWQALCDAAKAMHAHCIVIGSHGYSALDRFLGTTAAKVVNHADCSVLIVRPPSAKRDR